MTSLYSHPHSIFVEKTTILKSSVVCEELTLVIKTEFFYLQLLTFYGIIFINLYDLF